MTFYLDVGDVLFAAADVLGEPPQVRDVGLIASAVARPRASFSGVDAYDGIHAKAAALLESLVLNHAFVTGNKRAAWHATMLFYRANAYVVTADPANVYDLVVAIATHDRDLPAVAEFLAAHAQRSI